jgi:hypothetical protein
MFICYCGFRSPRPCRYADVIPGPAGVYDIVVGWLCSCCDEPEELYYMKTDATDAVAVDVGMDASAATKVEDQALLITPADPLELAYNQAAEGREYERCVNSTVDVCVYVCVVSSLFGLLFSVTCWHVVCARSLICTFPFLLLLLPPLPHSHRSRNATRKSVFRKDLEPSRLGSQTRTTRGSVMLTGQPVGSPDVTGTRLPREREASKMSRKSTILPATGGNLSPSPAMPGSVPEREPSKTTTPVKQP